MCKYWLAWFVFAALSVSSQAHAQVNATKLAAETQAYAEGFLKYPAGQVGVIVKGGCGSTSLTGRRVFLPQDGQIYWAVGSPCVRVVVNHRAIAENADPSYLGIQVVGFYAAPPQTSLILRRSGAFLRGQKPLPGWDDKEFAPEQLDTETWDSLNLEGNLEKVDSKITGRWYGVPNQGHSDSWEDRYKFRTSTSFDASLSVKYKTLDNRLIRFTPYAVNGSPNDGPVPFEVNRRGAIAVAIRVFSPVSADYDHSFVLVFESDLEQASKIINTRVVQTWPWNFFSR